jgi:toxin YoeB
MSYTIELTINAEKDIEKFKKSGDKKVLIKIDILLDELREHPKTGTGKPEQLKYYEISTWSRRLTVNHRLIYRIQEDRVVVMILSFWGHYGDK